jgi:GNAT superfamily N-acetyltransferase
MAEFEIRRATPADAEAIIALRAVMFEAMGVAGVKEPAWRQGAKVWLQRELAQRHTSASSAVDARGAVLAGALGTLHFELPSPANPSGVWGLVSNVATWPQARRRGLARACVTDVLDWLRDQTEAGAVELFATGEGVGIYEDLGFARTAWPAMRLRLER